VKPNNAGFRPIACGSILRRLVSKIAVAAVLPNMANYLSPLQVGVGVPGGAEGVIHAVSRVVQHHGHEDGFILALLDFSNAFNLVSRVRLMEQVCALCAAILEYTQVCYGGSAHMFVGHSLVEASSGVHQGDPLSPLLFALCIHPLITSLHTRFNNLLNAWFLDDGSVMGKTEEVKQLLQAVVEEGPAYGLVMNPRKTKIWWPQVSPDTINGFPQGVTILPIN
jgi:Reverse transcriptase (RNA-dependent DNA polymerase)